MEQPTPTPTKTEKTPLPYKGRTIFTALVLVPLSVAPFLIGISVTLGTNWSAFGIGALGWFIALLLRAPIIGIIIQIIGKDKITVPSILISGPCEESMRVAAVVVVNQYFPSTWVNNNTNLQEFDALFSLGVGWGAIEVLMAVIQILAIIHLFEKTDEKSMAAKQEFEKIMGGRKVSDNAPEWAAVERISANMLHLSFSVVLRFSLWLAIPFAIVHSLVNLGAVKGVKTIGVAKMELLLFAFSASLFAVIIGSAVGVN